MTIFALSFAAYSLAIVGVGLYSARYSKGSDEDYFLAGRSLGGWVAALSASASSESGWVTLGLVGWAFAEGVQAYWIIPGCLLGYAFNWFVVAGRLSDRSRALGAVTIPDFFSLHFRERRPILRVLSVLVIAVAMLLYVAAQFAAAGKSFAASFEGLNYGWGVLIGAGIVLVYTVLGGFRAVCWTDFLQALLMVGTLVVFPIYLLAKEGGYDFIDQQLSTVQGAGLMELVPSMAPLAFMGFLLGSGALGINFGYPGQPHVLVRFMALRSRKEAITAGVVAITWGALVYWGAVTVGLVARAMILGGVEWGAGATAFDGEQGLVYAAKFMLPGVLSGLVLAAVLAAICSTADSQLVVAASALANDLYARLFSRNKSGQHVGFNRLAVALLGLGAVLLVVDERVQVYQYVLTYGWAILGAAFGPQMILALFWRRASYAGCVAGMAVGFVVPIVWQQLCSRLGPDLGSVGSLMLEDVYNLPLAFVLAMLVNLIVSALVPTTAGTTDPELDPLCPQCGSSLCGATGPTCPECGSRVTARG